MTHQDSAPSEAFAELHTLVAANLSREITPEQSRRLNEMLRDPATLDLYLEIVYATGTLLTWAGFQRPDQSLLSPPSDAANTGSASLPNSAAQPNSAAPAKSPVLGFLGGVMDYVNHSRMLMFWLMALVVSGWFIVQLGSLMMGRARPGNGQLAGNGNAAQPNSSDVSTPPGGSFANMAFPSQRDSVAPTTTAWITAVVDCHWRVVPPAVPTASAPTPGDAGTAANTDLYKGEPFHVGSEFSAGQQLDLIHGWAAITFRSGARIVLNGPAHFTIGSALGGKLQVGKLTARVPHDAHGFTVNTPAGKVVDLGTEFGVAVAPNHTMDVEVFVGQVSVDSVAVDTSSPDGQTPNSPSTAPTKPQKLTAGHAAHVEAGKPVATIPLDPKRFVRGLGPREDAHVAQAAYLDFVRSLKPVVWFRMEGRPTDRVLHDEMGSAADAKLNWDGPGNPFVEGHVGKGLWLRGEALKDYCIAPDYPKAEHGKLSVSAWVYAASHPAFATIAANWPGGRSQFQFLLQRMGNGTVLMAHVMQPNGKYVTSLEPEAHPFPLYEWQHVAFTTDGETLRLYRQGREVGTAKHAGLVYPTKLKAVGIGVTTNEAGTAPSETPSWFDGKLDEVAIFNDVLSADDIRKLAAAPPQ